MATEIEAGDVTVSDAVSGALLDFDAAKGSTSWERADGMAALIERASTYGFLVTLPDGEESHTVALAREGSEFLGWCDCGDFQNRKRRNRSHDGPCAHLSALRKAAFLGERDTDGRQLSIAQTAVEDTAAPQDETDEERAATDGGQIDRALRADTEGRPRVPGELRR